MDGGMPRGASEYEQRAWLALLERERATRDGLFGRGADAVAALGVRAGERLRGFRATGLLMQAGDETMARALDGGFKAVFLPAVRSVSVEARTEKLFERYPYLESESPFLALDLKDLDRGRPTLTLPFVGMLESAVASLAVTGATVSVGVSGGTTSAVALVAVASDTVASLALLGRAVAEVAVHYGYDPKEPEEELFLMGVLNYSTATSSTSKTAALAGLSRLTQQMMRRTAWEQLGKDPLVRVIQRVFQALGLRLTHRRLANVVPIAGGVVSAGLSFVMLSTAIEDATRLYRTRYLAEKHGLTWDGREETARSVDKSERVTKTTMTEVDTALDELLASGAIIGSDTPDSIKFEENLP